MVFKINEEKLTFTKLRMDYCQRKDSSYFDQLCSFQMSSYKCNYDKMAKRSSIPLCKRSVENINMCSPLFTSKTYTSVNNSILSQIVGGFIGSKSQMNNNNHNLSYDLSAAIFNLLNPCKYEKEKLSIKKNNEKNYCKSTSKIQPESYQKYTISTSSQKNEEKIKDCVVGVMECLVQIPLMNCNDQENYALNFSEKCDELNSKDDRKLNEYIQKNSNDIYNCDEKPLNENRITLLHCDNIQNSENSFSGEEQTACNSVENSQQSEPILECLHNPNLKKIVVENLKYKISVGEDCQHLPVNKIDYSKHLVNSLITERLRQQSECSIESTDSESFIVFDDLTGEDGDDLDEKMCLKTFNGDYDSDDEYDEGSSDEYDYVDCSIDKELIDANQRWSENYKDVTLQKGELDRKVKFNDNIKINKIIAWNYAYRVARPGPWEQIARDRVRFWERISRLSSIISPVLEREHRNKIYRKLYS